MVSHHLLMSISQSQRNIFEIVGSTNYLFEEFVLSLKPHRPHIYQWSKYLNQMGIMLQVVVFGMCLYWGYAF